MKEEQKLHPKVGDTLVLTDIVHKHVVLGIGLPCGYKLQNSDQTFDEYEVEVVDISTSYKKFNDETSDVRSDKLTLKKPNGETTTAIYKGREPICGTAGGIIITRNSQNAQQCYKWHKK